MAQLVSASALGAEGPPFESEYPDKRQSVFAVAFYVFHFSISDSPIPERVKEYNSEELVLPFGI